MKAATDADGAGCQGSPLLALMLVLFAVGAVWTYAHFDRADQYDREYVGVLAEARFLSQRVATHAGRLTAAGTGQTSDPFAKLQSAGARFEQVLEQLRRGNPESGMPPATVELEPELHALEQLWKRQIAPELRTLSAHRESIAGLGMVVEQVNARAERLLALSDQIATGMAGLNAASAQVYIASRQLLLSQRFAQNVNRVLEGGEGAVTAADRFGRDAALFGRVVGGLLNGNPALGIERVSEPAVRSKLEEVNAEFTAIREHVGAILQRSPEMFTVNEAARQVGDEADTLVVRIDDLEQAYLANAAARGGAAVAITFGAVALVLLLAVLFRLQRGTRARRAGMSGARAFASPSSQWKDPNFYK